MTFYLISAVIIVPIIYLLVNFIFDLLLRGFSPFIPSRPWVVEQIMNELAIPQENPKMLALSSGRSGFFYALKKRYPSVELTGLEPSLFPFLVSRVQAFIRRSGVRVIHEKVHRAQVKDYDFIYSHLYPDALRGLGHKLKFECRPGAQIVSTGFNIPGLTPSKVIDLPDRKGRLDFLSKNQKLFQSKDKQYKKEKKAYFYEI